MLEASTSTSGISEQQLRQQLIEQQHLNQELQAKIEGLQITLESADVNYELLKQKCFIQFENFEKELSILRQNQRQIMITSGSRHHRRETSSAGGGLSTAERHEISRILHTTDENSRDIGEVDLRVQLLENTRYKGHLMWKIDDFRVRRQETLTGEVTSLHSAPCLTADYGYRFCLRIYLNGDGIGEGTHLSLFLVIMKSDYDNTLEWPFQKKISITLVNQQNRKRDLVQEIVPNEDSECFHKPKKDYNVATGLPYFAPIDKLESDGFLKDDCIFIDVNAH